ncbi:MAG: ORF6N domain-containing protein [Saprospiraceae bacterium]|nr:ORF6N domain-containing protein [Saprospiraceae bacterium]MCF8251516.1 ORF6N domain-containing protein [Saprospiraceae bacterium]MCF8280767.1 ORF6N domain-containing protein [Bacteroidales bacterium]MCF8313376.1 ORF6N domain-containing protein [Saprospiraceae bacterium]MCF8441804.1 ORF6N domain-containing protein [Saprospiraceae bacterium]
MELQLIQQKIHEIRGMKVMLDADLAEMYGIETKVLKQAVRRNLQRFPPDFMFELTKSEFKSLRSQIVTLEKEGSQRGKYSKYLPFVFTEQGVAMLSSVLNSEKAIAVNIAIMRAFVAIRRYALTYTELALRLDELEIRFEDVEQALTLLMRERKDKKEWEKRERIGFKK